MAVLLKSDGSKEVDVQIKTLHQMQELVGGYIEIVYLKDKALVVNEEGLLKNLPINIQATDIAKQIIVGDAIYCGIEELN